MMVKNLESFEVVKPIHGEIKIRSGPHRGWTIQFTGVIRAVEFKKLDENGAPIYDVGVDVHSVPTPPVKEENDNR